MASLLFSAQTATYIPTSIIYRNGPYNILFQNLSPGNVSTAKQQGFYKAMGRSIYGNFLRPYLDLPQVNNQRMRKRLWTFHCLLGRRHVSRSEQDKKTKYFRTINQLLVSIVESSPNTNEAQIPMCFHLEY